MATFYFAWADATETAFGVEHQIEDEQVFAFELHHVEGEFPTLSLEVHNPRVGLLNAGRKTWGWFSYEDEGSGTVTPLFFGRLVGIPTDLQAEVIRLDFVARPADYTEQRETLAEGMRTLPWFDPLWIAADQRENPDAVLESRTAMWHVDRVTHVMSASDILSGEDGTVAFDGNDVFEGSVSISYGDPPQTSVEVRGQINWSQVGSGSIDISKDLYNAFKAKNSVNGQMIASYTGEGLWTDWPKKGDRIGSGWAFGTSTLQRADGTIVSGNTTDVNTAEGSYKLTEFAYKATMFIDYDVSRARTEVVTFTLSTDVQPIVTDSGDETPFRLEFGSSDVTSPIDAGGAMPIGDLRRHTYFNQDRGKQSIEYLVLVARAQLLAKARCVHVSWETSFANVVGLSCRKNAVLSDDRLPGGQAAGKIVGYSMACNGDTGALFGSVQIACAVGNGNTVIAPADTPTYAAPGYMEPGYQVMNEYILPGGGDVYFSMAETIADDGYGYLQPTAEQAIEDFTVYNGAPEQLSVITVYSALGTYTLKNMLSITFGAHYTYVDLTLNPLKNTDPFESTYVVTPSLLMAPKQIDLEAA